MFTADRWSDPRLALKPGDKLGFECPWGGKRCDATKRQPMVLRQPFDGIFTQTEKFCDLRQLQPSIYATCHVMH